MTDQPDYASFIRDLLATRHAEALEWLRRSQGKATLGEPPLDSSDPTDTSIALVEEIYAAGARQVIAVEIDQYREPDGTYENTGRLLIELPADPLPRRRVFKWIRNFAESKGFDGEADMGQTHLFVMLD